MNPILTNWDNASEIFVVVVESSIEQKNNIVSNNYDNKWYDVKYRSYTYRRREEDVNDDEDEQIYIVLQ